MAGLAGRSYRQRLAGSVSPSPYPPRCAMADCIRSRLSNLKPGQQSEWPANGQPIFMTILVISVLFLLAWPVLLMAIYAEMRRPQGPRANKAWLPHTAAGMNILWLALVCILAELASKIRRLIQLICAR